MNIPIRTDPDFKPDAKRTIDLRPFFNEPNQKKATDYKEDMGTGTDEEETFDMDKPLPDEWKDENIPPSLDLVVSPALRAERKRQTTLQIEREERRIRRPFKYLVLYTLLDCLQAVLVSLLEVYQTLEGKIRPFETKHTERQLYYLGLSLPNTVKSARQVLLFYPNLSKTQRYKVLRARRDTLRMYEKIYEKKR